MKRPTKVFNNRLKTSAFIFFLSILAFHVSAQSDKAENNDQHDAKKMTYIMPDGSVLPANKLDSLRDSWGANRIMFGHSQEDDEKNIIHLVRATDEMLKSMAEANAKREQAMEAMINQPASDFTLQDVDGKTWSLKKLKGKVVVLNFWFTSCPPCIQEMPELNSLVEKYSSKDVVFLGLTFNDAKGVTAFLKEHTFTYKLLPSSHEVDMKYNISAWPASFVIGRDGKIKLTMNSSSDIASDLSKSIDAAL